MNWEIVETAENISKDELLEGMDKCYSIENYQGHGLDEIQPEYAGIVRCSTRPNRIYLISKDKGGTFWYETYMQTDAGRKKLVEYIFGDTEANVRRRHMTLLTHIQQTAPEKELPQGVESALDALRETLEQKT